MRVMAVERGTSTLPSTPVRDAGTSAMPVTAEIGTDAEVPAAGLPPLGAPRAVAPTTLRSTSDEPSPPIPPRGPTAAKGDALAHAIRDGVIGGDKIPLALMMDMDDVKKRVDKLMSAMPAPKFCHTFAVKANPCRAFMSKIAGMGIGFETASIGELTQALRAVGAGPDRCWQDAASSMCPSGRPTDSITIVFDSPVKTIQEIGFALSHKVPLNVDNWQEIKRVDDWVEKNGAPSARRAHDGVVGIRVNPQVGGMSRMALLCS